MNLKFILLELFVTLLIKFGDSNDGGGKIVGGQIMDISSIPYFISVLYRNRHICGGSIVNEYWILSAAHCSQNLDAGNFSVRSGSSRKSRGGQIHLVEEMFRHPNYSANTLDNDFMLLRLEEPLEFDEKRQPITLAESYMYYDGAHVLTSGFGETQNKMESSEFLRGVIVDITKKEKCDNAYKNMITSNMFCAASEKKDSCQGDSGGPVESVYYGSLLGVVSFGVSCADSNYPGVYAKVSEAKDWIEEVTNIDDDGRK